MAYIPSYYEGLLSEDDMSSLRLQSLASGLLGASAAFSRAGAPSTMPQGSGLSNALQGFNQSYQGTVDTALQNMIKATQVQELVRKQKQAQQLNQLYQSAYTPGKQTAIPSEIGPAVVETPGSFDMAKIIPQLQRLGPDGFGALKDMADSTKALRQLGLMGGGQAPSPFAPYLDSPSPRVKTLAMQLEQGLKSGVIDVETAYKRIEPLAKMEETYLTSQASSAERMDARQAAAAERADKRLEGGKPTESEQKAFGFAQRMELADQLMKDIVDKTATAQLEGGGKNAKGEKILDPYATTKTQVLGSIPLAGDYLRDYGSSKQQMLYRQAQENWVRANLRKESGAVIGSGEMNDEIRNYFPAPNDPPELVAQKNLNRQVTQDAMRVSAGKLYVPFDMKKYKKDRGLE